MKADAYLYRIIEEIFEGGMAHVILTDKYDSYNRDMIEDLLVEYNLIERKLEIEKLEREISGRANKLISKLEKLIDKWKEKYNIV